MAEKQEDGKIIETATEARQAEPGPPILVVLITSVVLAVIFLGTLWFVFFRA
jgi:cobalamin biosynthesis Mg chelatase CobN